MSIQPNSINKGGYPYNFKFLCKTPMNKVGFLCDYVYTFVSKKNLKYQVNLHYYDVNVFAVKFHLKKHHKNKSRYNILTNSGDSIIVLKTVIAIMLDILQKNENCSFCFIGSPLASETISKTKRFVVYEKLMKKHFNPDNFSHEKDESISFYCLINLKNEDKNLSRKISDLVFQYTAEQNEEPINLSGSTK